VTAAKLKLALVIGVLVVGAAGVLLVLRGRPAPPVVDLPSAPVKVDAAPAPPAQAEAPTDALPLPPDYDPTVLLAGGANPIDVFVGEPRSPAWANEVERVIGKKISDDLERLVPEAQGMGMTCHTLSCIVMVGATADHLPKVVAATKFITLGPQTIDLPPDEKGRARWLFFTERRFADGVAFTTWYLGARKRALAAIKAGTQPNPFSVAAEKLPEE
jgi:hypothetical protein